MYNISSTEITCYISQTFIVTFTKREPTEITETGSFCHDSQCSKASTINIRVPYLVHQTLPITFASSRRVHGRFGYTNLTFTQIICRGVSIYCDAENTVTCFRLYQHQIHHFRWLWWAAYALYVSLNQVCIVAADIHMILKIYQMSNLV